MKIEFFKRFMTFFGDLRSKVKIPIQSIYMYIYIYDFLSINKDRIDLRYLYKNKGMLSSSTIIDTDLELETVPSNRETYLKLI